MTTHITHHAIRQQQLLNELGISVWVERTRPIISMDAARAGVDVTLADSQHQVDPNETRLESALLVAEHTEVKQSAADAMQPVVEHHGLATPTAEQSNEHSDPKQQTVGQQPLEQQVVKHEVSSHEVVEHEVVEHEADAQQADDSVRSYNHLPSPETHTVTDDPNIVAANATPDASAYDHVGEAAVLYENTPHDMPRVNTVPVSSSQPNKVQPTQSIVPQAPFLLYALVYRNAVILCDDASLTHEAAAQLWQNIQHGLGVSAIQINFPLSDGLPRQKNYAVATLSGWFYQLTHESSQGVSENQTSATPTFVLLGESEAPIHNAVLTEQGLDLQHQQHDALITLPSVSEMVSHPSLKKQLWQCIQR